MEQIKYFYCKTCNKGVESSNSKCDSCEKHFKGKTVSRLYTKEQIEELVQQKMQELEGAVDEFHGENEDGDMLCPVCGKRYDITESFCSCGSPLVPNYKTPVEVNVIPENFGEGEMYGEVIENPVWKLKVIRYRNNIPEEATKEILLNRKITAVGRVYIALNHLFTYNVVNDQNSIVNVSKFNAVFVEEDGRLYVQYDNLAHESFPGEEHKNKTPIYINGVKLESNQRRQLTSEDSVTMGNGAPVNMNLCVELVVQKIKSNVAYNEASIGRLEEMMMDFGEKMDYNAEMQKQILDSSKEIKDRVIKLGDIQAEKFDKMESYLSVLEKFEADYKATDTTRTDEDYINLLLANTPKADELLASLNDVQLKYLSTAAFYDAMATERGTVDQDYSGAFIYLSKLIENFLNNTIKDFLEKYCAEQWKDKKNNRYGKIKKHHEMGDFTKTILQAEKENNTFYKSIAEDINKKNVRQPVGKKRVRDTLLMFNDIREIRNKAAHGSEEKEVEKMDNVDRDTYEKMKKLILESTVLLDWAMYHELLFGKKN